MEFSALTLGPSPTLWERGTEGMVEAWIKTHRETFKKGPNIIFAIIIRERNILCGTIGLELNSKLSMQNLVTGLEFPPRGVLSESSLLDSHLPTIIYRESNNHNEFMGCF